VRGNVIVDAGPLVALLERRGRHHEWAKQHFSSLEPPLLTCEAVLAEACHLVRRLPDGIPSVLEALSRGLLVIALDLERESQAVAQLVTRYQEVPMSLADACLVRMSELHSESIVMTLDSDFRIYRQHGRRVIRTITPDRT